MRQLVRRIDAIVTRYNVSAEYARRRAHVEVVPDGVLEAHEGAVVQYIPRRSHEGDSLAAGGAERRAR